MEKDTTERKNLLIQPHNSHSCTKLKDFKIRGSIYIVMLSIGFIIDILYN